MKMMAGSSKQRDGQRATRARAAALLAIAWLAPRAAQACAVCVSSLDDGTQFGFMLGTLIMTPTPFLVVGGVIYFLWRRARAAELELNRSSSSPS